MPSKRSDGSESGMGHIVTATWFVLWLNYVLDSGASRNGYIWFCTNISLIFVHLGVHGMWSP
ncbi:hypothetical protein EI94DRAFT_1742660, partial [Lactarius quietus]